MKLLPRVLKETNFSQFYAFIVFILPDNSIDSIEFQRNKTNSDIIFSLKENTSLKRTPKLVLIEALSSKLNIYDDFLVGYASNEEKYPPNVKWSKSYIHQVCKGISENKKMDICELLEKVNKKLDKTKELRSLSLNKTTERDANDLVGYKIGIKSSYESRLNGKLLLSSPETYKSKF